SRASAPPPPAGARAGARTPPPRSRRARRSRPAGRPRISRLGHRRAGREHDLRSGRGRRNRDPLADALLERRLGESGEERVRLERLALELRVVLAADEVRVSLQLDHLDEPELLVDSARDQPLLLELRAIGIVDLVPVAMSLADLWPAVDLRRERTRLQRAGICAEPHGSTLRGHLLLFLHQRDHRVRRSLIELVAVGLLQAADVAGELDGGHLQAEADAKERHLALPRI